MTSALTTRAALLKSRTASIHAALDARIMELGPFASLEAYARFLETQLRFHRQVGPLYRQERMARLLPVDTGGSRVRRIEADMRDLGIDPPPSPAAPFGRPHAEAIGWLYVAEGSKLGAAVLLKSASKLGLDAGFGASHLAGHPAGRGYEWRFFSAALNALSLSPAEDDQTAEGAAAAFGFFADHLEGGFRGYSPRQRCGEGLRAS